MADQDRAVEWGKAKVVEWAEVVIVRLQVIII